MTEAEFTSFLERGLGLLARYSATGSVHFVCIDWRHMGELLAAGTKVYDTLLNVCVWAKNISGQGSFYRSRHKLVFVFRNGKGRHRNNIMLGKFGRYRTNVWEYPAVRGLSQQQDDEGNLLELHPTVKPVALVADAILHCSARGDLVLDGFLGSGSTLIAANRVGRICYGSELEPRYVDVAVRRWQRHTGDKAVHGPAPASILRRSLFHPAPGVSPPISQLYIVTRKMLPQRRLNGGRGGIRTPDTLSGTPVFKTGAINHSATLPCLDNKSPRQLS